MSGDNEASGGDPGIWIIAATILGCAYYLYSQAQQPSVPPPPPPAAVAAPASTPPNPRFPWFHPRFRPHPQP